MAVPLLDRVPRSLQRVERAEFGPSGTLGSWTLQTDLPMGGISDGGIQRLGMVAAGTRLYAAGGAGENTSGTALPATDLGFLSEPVPPVDPPGPPVDPPGHPVDPPEPPVDPPGPPLGARREGEQTLI